MIDGRYSTETLEALSDSSVRKLNSLCLIVADYFGPCYHPNNEELIGLLVSECDSLEKINSKFSFNWKFHVKNKKA